MRWILKFMTTLLGLLSMTACENGILTDAPQNKPVEERRVVLLDVLGNVYDQTGKLVSKLPNCEFASQIIADGEDWFVSGSESNGRIGYWKNGKWNTLHVDDLDDVDHTIYGMGKWDSYMYLFDYPKVLKNSGIFRLEDSDNFIPANMAISVSIGNVYVVGQMLEGSTEDGTSQHVPVLYTEHKGVFTCERLPMPEGTTVGECTGVHAYDGSHTVICGSADYQATVWVDKVPQLLPLTLAPDLKFDDIIRRSIANGTTVCGGKVYVGGYELDNDLKMVATVWCDGVPLRPVSGDPRFPSSIVQEVEAYGDDIYYLTVEFGVDEEDNDISTTILWMNGNIIARFADIVAVNFAVL
ncbi:MAG: hypothetical protein IJU62_04215 [Muribaculaceae bacterium]|nr:hypothetical protein [Muribaculaceae bacterium]